MGVFQIALILATFLCALVAGFLFAFAVVAMPGIGKLNDREFIRAFQEMDGIIQNNQPLFMAVWVGSVLALAGAAVLGALQLDGVDRLLLIIAAMVYIVGVQLPTVSINIPMNNELQKLDVDAASDHAQKDARAAFEPRWNRWNAIRAVLSSLATALLIALLFRI